MVFLLLLVGCGSEQPLDFGKTVHDFRLPTLIHGRFYLSEHRDQVVMLVFWATYCRPCKAELEALKTLRLTFPEEQLIIAAVCTNPENTGEVKEVVSGLNLNYPVLLDNGARLFRDFGFRLLPTTILIDTRGKIAFSQEGYDRQIHKQLTVKTRFLLDGGRQ
jgi:peroxiredoxin